jgi:AraC family transcriptional regulator of adaptative response/methylated-DNA-[protein]-cysteine methyltransferase
MFINYEVASTSKIKTFGMNLNITYGISNTPFGNIILAISDKGICELLFITREEEYFVNNLLKKWKGAHFKQDNIKIQDIARQIFYPDSDKSQLTIHLKGTDFQLKIWKALLDIPDGHVLSYKDIAKIINAPNAVRAVGNAIAKNPVTYLIPCHRVIRNNGNLGGYSGGIERKKAILASELIKYEANSKSLK